MDAARNPSTITIRPAVADDADGIIRTYLESADHHTRLDPDRYLIPPMEVVVARYREGQHSPHADGKSITLVADLNREIVGFVDARLQQSPDPMHRDLVYCHIVEIAVSARHQSHGIGAQLLRAAEDWGRQQGAQLASLEYLAANVRAGSFYQQRMGYRIASVTAIKPL
jgi:ribosomal protein S18 acetylase RimI-like enzyme